MLVAELLHRATGAIEPALSGELLRQAEMREVQDARTFLLHLASWKACSPNTVWALRTVFNAHDPSPLWVPLTFKVPGVTRVTHGTR